MALLIFEEASTTDKAHALLVKPMNVGTTQISCTYGQYSLKKGEVSSKKYDTDETFITVQVVE